MPDGVRCRWNCSRSMPWQRARRLRPGFGCGLGEEEHLERAADGAAVGAGFGCSGGGGALRRRVGGDTEEADLPVLDLDLRASTALHLCATPAFRATTPPLAANPYVTARGASPQSGRKRSQSFSTGFKFMRMKLFIWLKQAVAGPVLVTLGLRFRGMAPRERKGWMFDRRHTAPI